MRFVLMTGLMTLFSANSFAAPWDVAPTAHNASAAQGPVKAVQRQRGGTSSSLQTLPELDISVSMTGLGDISAITLGEDGTLYTADKKTGRIWALSDRRQDGKIDLRRPLPYAFNQPTGLAAIGSTLYAVDQNAVWAIAPGQDPQELASLRAANSSGHSHILRAGHDGTYLVLGLTTQDQNFRILKIDTASGEAVLIGDGTDGPLQSLALNGDANIWAGFGNKLSALGADPTVFSAGQTISGIVLPGRQVTPVDWPPRLRDHIIVSQAGPNAMRLLAIPTEFGQISAAPRELLGGFLNRSQRSAWGAPGAMVMDKRGLFVADYYNGTLLRLSPKPKAQPKITIVDTDSLDLPTSKEPVLAPANKGFGISSTIQGTQIDTKSTITQPSSIIYGSKLIKDYDAKKALEEAEKAENAPKSKKRRMSRSRQQKDN